MDRDALVAWSVADLGVTGGELGTVRAPTKVLSSPAAAVDPTDPDIVRLAAHLLTTMRANPGCVGLAAPQVGLDFRLAVIDLSVGEDPKQLHVIVNPEVVTRDGSETAEEGCLSLPGVHIDVDRNIHVRVRAQDEYGEPRLIEASGLEARVLQHEIDHLNGVLITDHASREQRKEAIRTLRDQERGEEAA